MSNIAQKIQHGWGFRVTFDEPGTVGLSYDGEKYVVTRWPTANPPTITEIEAVQLPAPTPQPNWAGFQMDLIESAAYRRVVGANSNTLAIAPVLSNLAFRISEDASVIPRFVQAWNQIATLASPTSSERTALNTIAANNNVPFQLNAQGLIEI